MVGLLCALIGLVLGPSLERVVVRVPERDRARRIPVLAGWRPGERDTVPKWRHPAIVPVTSALTFGVFGWHFDDHLGVAAVHLVLAAVLVCVTFVDIDTLRIPDRLTFPGLAVAVAATAVVALAEGEPGWLQDAAIGAAAFFAVLFVFNLVYPAGMGFGDVKLALLLGWYLGWSNPLLVVHALLFASALGTVIGIALMARGGDRKRGFPFGPGLCLGTVLAIVMADTLLP